MESIKRNISTLNKQCSEKVHSLDIEIPNLILTPLTCSSLIGEILKCLIFEKSLIPYHYNWLKNVADGHKKSNVLHENKKNINIDRKQRVAVAAFDAVENIINNVTKLFKLGNGITEFLVLIGATPVNPKEVYRINIPNIAKGHIESNHYTMITKFQPKVMRSLLLSKEWMSKMEQSIPLTNLYTFVKIANGKSFFVDKDAIENFVPSSSFFVPKAAQILTINLLFDDSIPHNCCAKLTIYEDKCIKDIIQSRTEDESKNEDTKEDNELLELNVEWLQANSILKGFK